MFMQKQFCLSSVYGYGFAAIILAMSQTLSAAGEPEFSLVQSPHSSNGSRNVGNMDRRVLLSENAVQRESGRYAVLVKSNGTELAGVNFDVELPLGLSRDSISIDDCGGASAGTHIARCEFVDEDTIRVLIFSAPVTSLPASFEGISFEVSAGNGKGQEPISIQRDSVAASGLDGKIVSSSVK